jgi:hypothetical protein
VIGIARLFKWLKCLGEIPRLQPTSEGEMSTSILRVGYINISCKIPNDKVLVRGFISILFFLVQGSIIPTVHIGILTCFVNERLPVRVHGGKSSGAGTAYNSRAPEFTTVLVRFVLFDL